MAAIVRSLIIAGLFISFSSYAGYFNENSPCADSYSASCQCTDVSCTRGNSNCVDKATCCEAFGNVGAR